VDIRSGKRIWHFQLSHHDIWDYDPPAGPILVDVPMGGKNLKAVVQITKQGFAFVFDRVTGKPVWPVEERPVPQTDLAGERTAPTQPFPTRPAPFELQGVSLDDLNDFTPELHAEAVKIASQYRLGPLFTPPSLKDHPSGTKGTLNNPGSNGGGNWDSGAVDPETGVLYITSVTRPVINAMTTSPNSNMNFVNIQSLPKGPQGLPLMKPPYGRITAIDLKTGEKLWMVPNGETPDEVRNHPALKGLNIPRTGRLARGNVLLTKTLFFAGVSVHLDGEPVLQAFDKATGNRIAAIRLPGLATGAPMTYMLNGKQYIVVAVGGRDLPGEFVALTLPSEDSSISTPGISTPGE
jgi:quinoprotein glucose dehydrogenase